MRKLSWIIAGILCTTPAALLAAELGAPKLESHLTERLKVTIPITGLNGTPLDEVKVRLAPESYYQQAGIPLDPLAGNIMFQVKSGKKGPYVQVSSKRSISDPILSMLLEVQTSHGTFIKEYDLLLNPPVHGESPRSTSTQFQQIAPQVVSSTQTNSSSISSTPSTSSTSKTPVWHTIKDVPDIKLEGEYKVKRGDTLYDIAKQTATGTDVAVRPLMQAIINANPHAFVDGNGNTLRAGATLKVPAPTSAKATAPSSSAASEEKQPKLQLLSPDTETAGKTPVGGSQPSASAETTTTADQPAQTGGADQPPAKLPAINSTDSPTSNDTAAATALAQQNNEAIASIDAKSEAMSHQIDMLNTQLKQVQDQIVVRNQNIDQLQKKVHESQSQTQSLQKQLEEQKNSFWIQWGPYLAGAAGLLLIAMLLLLISGRSRKNSIDRLEPMADKRDEKHGALPISSAVSPAADEKSLDEMSHAAPAVATTAAAGLAATASMASIPPFNAQTLIEESRLLVSYNLHTQAIDMLQDAVSDHPDELSLYQELARIHAESKDENALNEVLSEIDQRFGSGSRPDLSDLQEQIAMQSAPIPIFENSDSLSFREPEAEGPGYEQPLEKDPVLQEPLDIDLTETKSSTVSTADSEESNLLEFSLDEPYDTASPEAISENQSLNIEEPKSIDFDLDMPDSPAGQSLDEESTLTLHEEGSSLDPSLEETQPVSIAAETDSPVSSEQNDTRLGLVEAFLGVGDLESYKMIAEEIEGEGDAKLIAALRDIEKAHGI